MIILSCDHAGYDYTQQLAKFLDKQNIEYKYMGPKQFNKEDDYPDYIIPASKEVLKSKENIGIFMCGSGIGANIVAIADGKPKQLGLIEILKYYVNYQQKYF